ncbi:hypothetical protein AKJ42_00915 [candidate division MSBL1 archaeon SCGC-AAA261C02]|uniref:Probable RNA 2'-phosphotransferase n=1 Tax=candidate division MSBL1 archaeon SCGC-AAA261C02 TaxID=1698272 RepID=A0A133V1T1_9EURY|nr:hypothetical protein AKJ42_00915 [candidate division MSBL1 archaeon SCGC-AAA261C02]
MVRNQTKISKYLAYLLRHNPSGMKISREGFVSLEELLGKLRKRWPNLSEKDLQRLVKEDSKGRYEIKGREIRARYGHSIDVNPTLPEAKVDKLYHGTTYEASQKILEEGLKSKGRQKIHLSASIEDAVEVGKRRTSNPVVLAVNVKGARRAGIRVEKASDKVFVAHRIPSRFISKSSK